MPYIISVKQVRAGTFIVTYSLAPGYTSSHTFTHTTAEQALRDMRAHLGIANND